MSTLTKISRAKLHEKIYEPDQTVVLANEPTDNPESSHDAVAKFLTAIYLLDKGGEQNHGKKSSTLR